MNRNGELVNGEYYHIYNRGSEKRIVFSDKSDYKRAISLISYYQYLNPPVKYSFFIRFPSDEQSIITNKLSIKNSVLITIVAYCLMPNHFHLILKQNTDSGISKFMSNFQNSYTKYYNTKHDRVGPLFQGAYKLVRIENDEHMVHLSRYIHLNPVTSFVIKPDHLFRYQWSSVNEYVSETQSENGLCDKKLILSHFSDSNKYSTFLTEYIDITQELHALKKLIFDES